MCIRDRAALAAFRHQQAIAMPGQVADDFIGAHVGDCGADRHGDHQVIATRAIALLAHAVLATLGTELALVAEIDQRAQVFVGHDPDTACLLYTSRCV